jgi:PAS domain S-box-containing protein
LQQGAIFLDRPSLYSKRPVPISGKQLRPVRPLSAAGQKNPGIRMGENKNQNSRLTEPQAMEGGPSAVRQLQERLEHTEADLRLSRENQSVFIQKLKKARRDFLAIFDLVPAMIWYRDRQGQILRVNRCAADSIGMTAKELVGRNYYELFPEDAERSRQSDLQVIQTGSALCGQLRQFTSFDGTSTRWALVDRFPLRDREGRIEGVMVFAQDITEKKRAEDRLIRARKEIELRNEQLRAAAAKAQRLADSACKSNQAKSEMLASSSHDLRTPMNAIIGFADLLLETPLDEEQKQYVTTIRDSADGLLSLINDILDFARLEAGKLKIEIVPCFMREFIDQIRAMMETGARRKGLDFKIEIDPHLPPSFYTDPLRLKQCLINLLGNAVKFTDTGYVSLSVCQHQQAARSCIRFDVEDTGIGIAQDKQQEIFKVFSQAEAATARKYGGSGLGLTITRRLTDLLGGTIDIDSQPGRGSKFSITLPLLSSPQDFESQLTERNNTQRREDAVPLNGWRILLAETSVPSQLTMNLLLRRAGMNVRAVNSVNEMTQRLCSDSYDLILLDGGLDSEPAALVRKLRAEGHILPILVLLDNDDEWRQKLVQAGAGVLMRPVSRRVLYDTIAEQIQKAEYDERMKTLQSADGAVLDGERPEGADVQDTVKLLPVLVEELRQTLAESDRDQARQIVDVITTVSAGVDQPQWADTLSLLSQQLQLNEADFNRLQSIAGELDALCRDIFNCQDR